MILVTGGTGLIGSHLVYDLLVRGLEVKVLVREQSDRTNLLKTFKYYTSGADQMYARIHWVVGDITDRMSLEEAFRDVDEVYHLSAMVSFSGNQAVQIQKVNVEGTANVVNLCLERNIKKLCYVSSIASITAEEEGKPADESILCKPNKNSSFYSISKYKAEMEVWRGFSEGLRAVIVNPSVVLGPDHRIRGGGGFYHFIARGIPFYTSGSSGFTDVRDVSIAMIQLMMSDIHSERFVLNSENVTFKDLFTKIDDSLGNQRHRFRLPRFAALITCTMIRFLFRWLPVRTAFSKSIVDMAYKKNSYSSDKILKALLFGFRPIDETIQHMAGIYKKDMSVK
jgi:nucleoside-diphosphate-sugar epimerase